MESTAINGQLQAETTWTDYSAMTSEEMIVATLNLFCGDGITEIRCLGVASKKNRTDSGYFSEFDKAAKHCRQYVQDNCTRGVYFVVNEVPAELLARAANRIEDYATTTTSDAVITSRRWLYVDCDPVRPTGISSTNTQVQQAVERSADVTEWMRSQGLCEPIAAMSGNGAHLHFPISLPNDPDSLALVAGVLRTLKAKFSDDAVSIDTTVSNAARICRLYGTIARKGDSTADRPHRMARILSVPDYIQRQTGDVCNVDALRAVAEMSEPLPTTISRPATSAGQMSCLDRRLLPESYLRDKGIKYEIQPGSGGWTKFMIECPFNREHVRAFVGQHDSGAVQFKCSHNSCSGNDWQALKKKIGEPDPEHYDPPKTLKVSTSPANQITPFLQGERVRSADRGNVGTVVDDNGGPTVRVEFKGKEGVATLDKPRSLLQSLDGAATETKPLVFHDAWKAANKPRPMRECIIEGLLRRGEVANIIAATKIGKSWFALMLLICIATGRDWLGRRVARGNVLLIDNELHEETLENRISAVQFAMKIESDAERDRFEYVACRGNWVSIQDLMLEIPKQYPPGSLNLICIDAKYRLFGNGLEENSNDDQTTFHNLIDQFAAVMNCPIVLVHHATKGDQSGKAVTDIGSGGGSQSRTVDLHMVIRPHQQPELSVLDAGLRSFIKIEPVTLRWNWPLWSVASDVEPVLPKDSKDTERYVVMKNKVQKYLTDEWQSLAKLAERCSTKKDRNPFADIVEELQRQELIEINENFTPNNSKRETTGVRMTSDKMTSDNCPESLSERPD